MDFIQLLNSEFPGDELKAWQGPMPVFFDQAASISAGPTPWHTGSILDHMARCMNAVAGDPLAVWLAFAHDAGKLTTPSVLLPHHYGHEHRGAILAPIWAEQLKLDKIYAEAGRLTARWHMRAGRYPILRPGKKLQLLQTFPPLQEGKAFWKLVDADTRANISSLAIDDWHKLRQQGKIA